MDIGIGLPATITGTPGERVIDAARQGETLGFASLGVLDRLVYQNYEPLTVLAAAAAVTREIRLTTTVMVPTFRGSAVTLAKQAASIDRLSGGRLELGLAAGGREDDFVAAGAPYAHRGTRLTEMIAQMRQVWLTDASDPAAVGPKPTNRGPSIILGGRAPATFNRVARYADGWIAGGGNSTLFPTMANQAREAWTRHERPGAPKLMSIAYFALGAGAEASAREYLADYYAFLGAGAEFAIGNALTSADAVRREADAFAAAGCDELILFPCSSDPGQAELLADILL